MIYNYNNGNTQICIPGVDAADIAGIMLNRIPGVSVTGFDITVSAEIGCEYYLGGTGTLDGMIKAIENAARTDRRYIADVFAEGFDTSPDDAWEAAADVEDKIDRMYGMIPEILAAIEEA